jgi:hypothetical protein
VGLRDITGVFSRYFIVGFFLPSFFALVVIAQTATDSLLPAAYEDASWEGRFLQIGGVGLLIGLVLLGLNYPIIRSFEGYPFESRWYLRPLRRPLRWLQLRTFDELVRRRGDVQNPSQQSWAARQLDRHFSDDRERIMPTRFGNAIRASEDHAYLRWGLDAIAVWPRIDALLTEQERELHTNARSDMAFFVNSALGAFAVGVVLLVDEVAHGVLPLRWAWLYIVPFVAAYITYRLSAGAAERWGTELRASIDLHRLELYEKLGVRKPLTFTDEREIVARAVNRCLLWGVPIPDDLAQSPSPASPNRSRIGRLLGNLGIFFHQAHDDTKPSAHDDNKVPHELATKTEHAR